MPAFSSMSQTDLNNVAAFVYAVDALATTSACGARRLRLAPRTSTRRPSATDRLARVGACACCSTPTGGPRQPGPAAIAFVLQAEDGTVLASRARRSASRRTTSPSTRLSSRGFACARARPGELEVRSDSELMVKQMRGEYRVKNRALQELFLDASRLRDSCRPSLHARAAGAQRARRPAPERRARRRLRRRHGDREARRRRMVSSPAERLVAVVVVLACSCGGGRRRAVLGLAERRPVEHAVDCGVGHHRESVGRLRVAWRFRVTGRAGASASCRRRRSCGTASRTCRTPRSSVYAIDLDTGPQAVGATQAGAERRSQRPRARRRSALRGQRHVGVRARRLRRPPALEHAAREPDGAVRQHRAGRRSRPGLREHRRAAARWPWCDLRARRDHGKAALAVRHDQGAVAEPDGRRRRRLGAAERRRERARLRGHREPGALGRIAAVPERRLVPRPDALHRLARRPRRRQRRAPSGTTRCSRTTSGTTTSSSRRSSPRWRDATS